MSWTSLFAGGSRREPVADSAPAVTAEMPHRPYRVLHSDLPFYADSSCRKEVTAARLVVLQCEDPAQVQRTVECMPTLRSYRAGQLVSWDLNNKRIWEEAWYVHPETGRTQRAWRQAVEFIGQVVPADGV